MYLIIIRIRKTLEIIEKSVRKDLIISNNVYLVC